MKKELQSINIVIKGQISAEAGNIFLLVCPVMEYKWIPGWKCNLIHCPNGHVELGTRFSEIFSSPFLLGRIGRKTLWTAVLYEKEKFLVHYQLENAISLSLYKIEFESIDQENTIYRLDFTYTPINLQGERLIEKNLQKKIEFMLISLAKMLKFYSENGKLLPKSEILEMGMKFQYFTFMDRIRLFLNQKKMKKMIDEDRKRFFQGKPISKIAQ